MEIDRNNPFLRRGLDRLEDRFRKRYYSSKQKVKARERAGKKPHAASLRSIDENRERFETVRIIRSVLLGDELSYEMSSRQAHAVTDS